MKILLVQDWLRGGGTERQTVFLARAFVARGHAVTLLTFRPGGTLAGELAGTNVAHRTLQPFDLGLDWFAPRLMQAARTLAPDIVLCMGRMANSRAGQLQRALPRAAVIATLRTGKALPTAFRRSLTEVRHSVANSEFARRTHADSLCGGTHQRFDAVSIRSGTRQRFDAAERCSVIPNALLFPELLTLVPAPAEPPVILNVAQFRRGKGQRELVAACAGLPRYLPWRLEFVGDGPERPACERAAAEAGIADRVLFHGWQANPAGFYRRASIAALASQPGFESLPNFLVEAQCAGLPVIAHDTDGVGETFLDGTTGRLVPAGDRTAFGAALTELLACPPQRAAMAAAAQVWARARFNPDRQVEAYLALFERLRAES